VHPQALAAQPLEDVAANVVRYIRQLKPQVVLTFDPIGGYFHPDHIAIHRASRRAFEQAANPAFAPDYQPVFSPTYLYFHILPRGFLRLNVKIMPLFGRDPHKFGSNGDIDLAAIAAMDFPTHARINIRSVRRKKEKAGACHASQADGRLGGNLLRSLMRMFNSSEDYMRAYPPFMQVEKVSRDLFL